MELLPHDWKYVDERADSFVGREWVFARIRSFLSGPPGIFLLRGDPGTGKTAVAARLAQASCGRATTNSFVAAQPAIIEGSISAAVFCRADKTTTTELIQRLTRQLENSVNGFSGALQSAVAPEIKISNVYVEARDVVGDVTGVRIMLDRLDDKQAFRAGLAVPLRRLRELGVTQQIVLLVDAVDEAATFDEVNTFSRLLSKLEGVHLIVTCRPDPRVLADFRKAEHKVDLVADAPRYDNDVYTYAQNRLLGQGTEGVINVVADRIAKEAADNFLYVFHVTGGLAQSKSLAKIDERAARELLLPTGGLHGLYEDFLDRQIAGDETKWAQELNPVFAPLCVALGDGFTTAQIQVIASCLTGRDFSLTKVRHVIRLAGQFLDGPHPDGPFRVYHQSFSRFLTDPKQNPNWPIDLAEANNAVLQVLETEGGDYGWAASSPYSRHYAPFHAAAVGRLEQLARQPSFMVGMAPGAMREALRGLAENDRQDPIAIYTVSLPFLEETPGNNAVTLEVVSRAQGNHALARELAEAQVSRPYHVAAKILPFDRELARFDSHTAGVMAVATLTWPGLDHEVIVTTSWDGTARVWDPCDPGAELARFTGHAGGVVAVATLAWPGLDHEVIVTTSLDGTARVWDPCDPGVELALFTGHSSEVWTVATLWWPGLNHSLIVTGSADGIALVWDPCDPGRNMARFIGHNDAVWTVATLEWPPLGYPVIVTGSADRTAQVWDPSAPAQELARFTGHTDTVVAVTTLKWPGLEHPAIVTASADWSVQVWDPRDSARNLARFDGHSYWVMGVAALEWPGLDHSALVTTSQDNTARVWDPCDPGRELARFDGHTLVVERAAILEWPGLDHPVVVTTSDDATARVWDPRGAGQETASFNGHNYWVVGIACLEWPGLKHPAIVTTSTDTTARVWDPRDPDRELARFNGHTGGVVAAAALNWPGLHHQVIVTVSGDGTAMIWDPHYPSRVLARFDGHTSEAPRSWQGGVAVLAWPGQDHPVVVTTSADKTARVWDPLDPDRELAKFDRHTGGVVGVAPVDWPGLDHPLIITGSMDGTARIWDPCDYGRELVRLYGHNDAVWGVTTLNLPGLAHPLIVTASADGTARIWNPADHGQELARFTGHTNWVWGVAAMDWPGIDHQVIITTSSDGTARIWDPFPSWPRTRSPDTFWDGKRRDRS